MWEEISGELSLDGVRPISPDEEALSTICKITEDTARRVAAEQNSILEQREKEELGEEELMYAEVPRIVPVLTIRKLSSPAKPFFSPQFSQMKKINDCKWNTRFFFLVIHF